MTYAGAVTYPGPTVYPGVGVYDDSAPKVTARTIGVPRVEIVVDTVLPATRTATLYRLNGRQVQRVRAAIDTYAVGGFSTIDYEAPFGLELTYRAEMFDADGYSLGFTSDSSVRLVVTKTWMHNVLEPTQGLPVELLRGAAGTITRPTNATVAATEGSSIGVYGGGYRAGIDGVSLPFLTQTLADADTAQMWFGDPDDDYPIPAVLCIRTAAGNLYRLPRPFFAACTVDEVPINVHAGKTDIRWEMTATEVRPPAAGLVLSGYTLGDIDDHFATLGDIDDHYLTLLDLDSDFASVGQAGGTPTDPTDPGTPPVVIPGQDPTGYGEGTYGAGTYGS